MDGSSADLRVADFRAYNERCKAYRKLLHHELNPIASAKLWGNLERQARVLVAKVDKEPHNVFEHLRGCVLS